MEHFKLCILPDNTGWKVTSRDGSDGPFETLAEALEIAAEAARVLRAAGHTTEITTPHQDAGASRENTVVAFERQR